ncbi:MAG: amidohydrolase [Deltaproteobacteria bacterium]|nr:amidohydrolase [Deltaproteobacteria bacterium]
MIVIDADGHVFEPRNLWLDYLEPAYRDRMPQFVRDERGRLRLMLDGMLHPKPEGKGIGLPAGLRWPETPAEEQALGAFNPRRRLEDMDREGISLALLFPTIGLSIPAVQDARYAAALCRALNNWMADYCRARPDRLLGAAMIPLQDPDEAVTELRRAITELGLRAAAIRPNPVRDRNLNDPAYRPFYAAAEELGVPVMVHETTGHYLPTAGADRFDIYLFTHTLSHAFEQMTAALSLICGGVLEEFPGLRVGFLEAGASWVPYWLWRMDEHAEKRAYEVPWLKLRPSEYFARQCFVSCEADETHLPATLHAIGDDTVIFASDYPHWDAMTSGVVQALAGRPDLPEDSKAKILEANPRRLLGLV